MCCLWGREAQPMPDRYAERLAFLSSDLSKPTLREASRIRSGSIGTCQYLKFMGFAMCRWLFRKQTDDMQADTFGQGCLSRKRGRGRVDPRLAIVSLAAALTTR